MANRLNNQPEFIVFLSQSVAIRLGLDAIENTLKLFCFIKWRLWIGYKVTY